MNNFQAQITSSYLNTDISSLTDPLTVNSATNGLRRSQDFFDDTRQVSGHGPGSHDPSGAQDIIHGDVTVMLNVLDLLAVTWRFLQGLDDQCGSTRYHIHFSLTVLDSQSDGNFQAFPVLGGLGDVITNLFGRQTQRTNLGGQGRSGSHFTTNSTKADNLKQLRKLKYRIPHHHYFNIFKSFYLNFIGIKLGRHVELVWQNYWNKKNKLV